MKIERLLQINTAVLAVTSALLYDMGQPDTHWSMLMTVAAGTSIWLTDVTGWLRLNRIAASIAAAAVFLLVLFPQLFSWDNVLLIQAIARMLVYLQIVLLFQRKERRVYWQLIVLSLLLLVVATVFTQGALFGLLMVAYLFTALSAMVLLFLYHEVQLHAARQSAARPSAEASFFVSDASGKIDETDRSGREFLRRLVRMGLATLAFTAVAFFVLPRLGQPAWRSPFQKEQRLVGYAGEVELGALGHVIEDPAEVLRIKLTDPVAGRMVPVVGGLYLHGTVLTHYADRCWTLPYARNTARKLRAPRSLPRGEIALQSIVLEPMDRPEVFCVQPFFVHKDDSELRFDPVRQSVLRPEEEMGRRYSLTLQTNAFREGHQRTLVPAGRKPFDPERLYQVPRQELPTLVALAERWMAESGLPEERPIDRARFLANKLRDSGEFEYSLGTQRQDFTIDPIEDFLKNNPKGHCEYFATTLALMLRSQGIPARMIVGYKCDEFNPLGNYFQVRQLHAHTWVEIYLTPDQVPADEMANSGEPGAWAQGAWLRLDATPGSDADELGAAGQLLATAGKSIDWFQYVWNNYVMEMDRFRQRQAVYRPLANWARETYIRMTSLEWWKETGRQILEFLDPRHWNLDAWFSWRGGLIGMGICFVLVGVLRVARWLIRRWRHWIAARRRRATAAARTDVEFYRRFQLLLGRRGMRRTAGQTQREFARSVGGRIAAEPGSDELVRLPERIAEAFYAVRFGGHPLDKTGRETVEQALSRLEEVLGSRKSFSRRAKETVAS
ncbi:MAG: DUF3488 domain-containing protein [Pirellulales bacterium]|nr:DUF3488 domain-containing protein [Pirellulales bacterium]